MPLIVTPEIGIPLPTDATPEEIDSFRDKAHAMFNTVAELVRGGLEVTVTDEDRAVAQEAFSKQKPPHPAKATPGAIVHLESMLKEWDQEVLDVHRRLRNYVTNRLILESQNEDARVRLKALENLGKISSVGLFSERIDVNVTHRTLPDIEAELRRTLELYSTRVIDVTPKQDAPRTLSEIDLDAEFGSLDDVSPTSSEEK